MPARPGRPAGFAVGALVSSKKIFPVLLVFCLLTPLFFHGPRFGVPYIKGGDEPHYLVMVNSLLMDGDLDLVNNYEAARKGSWQAGKKFAGLALDPHLVWNDRGHQVLWTQVYEDPRQWKKGADGFYSPEKKAGVALDVSGLPGYSSHPAGIAFLLAPLLWPFRGTPWTEPLALLCSNLAVILSAFFFRRMLSRYTRDALALNLATLLAFLGTPLWAYGRTLFMEPFLLFFAVTAYWLALEKRDGFWPGAFLGLGALLKPNFLILLFPLMGLFVFEKRWKAAFLSTIGPGLATAAILYTNARWYGSPFTPPQPFWFGNPFLGLAGLAFSWNHGVLTFAPVVLLSLSCWGRFLREHRAEAWVIATAFILYFLMMSLYGCWWGGWCYGPRLVGPVLALLMAPLFYLPEVYDFWGKPLRVMAVALCLASLAFNVLGALDGYWDSHPLTIFLGNVS